MDDDVKLSMVHSHEMRITKTIVVGVLAFCAIAAGSCSYNDKVENDAKVQQARSAADTARAEADKARDDRALFEMWGKPAPASSK